MLFWVDLNVVQKTFPTWKNREAFYVSPFRTAHVDLSWALNVQSDLHVVQNAFTNYPRIMFNVLDRWHLVKEEIFYHERLLRLLLDSLGGWKYFVIIGIA